MTVYSGRVMFVANAGLLQLMMVQSMRTLSITCLWQRKEKCTVIHSGSPIWRALVRNRDLG